MTRKRLEYLHPELGWTPSLIRAGDCQGSTPAEKVAYLNSLPTRTEYRLADAPQTR